MRRTTCVIAITLAACTPPASGSEWTSAISMVDATGDGSAAPSDSSADSDAPSESADAPSDGSGSDSPGPDAGPPPATCRRRDLGTPDPRFVRFSYGSNASQTTPDYADFPRSISELMTHRRADRWRTGEPNPHAGCGSNCHSGGTPASAFGTIYLQVFDRQLGAFRPGMSNPNDTPPALPDGFDPAAQWLSILTRIKNRTMPRSVVIPETYPRWIDYPDDFTTTTPQDGFNQFPSPVRNDYMRRNMMNYILDRLDALCEPEICCSLPTDLEPNPDPRVLSRYACERVGGTIIAETPMCTVI